MTAVYTAPAVQNDTEVREKQILVEIAQGDSRNFKEFVDDWAGDLMSLISRMVGNRHTAEDLTQQAFLNVFKAVRNGSWRPDKPLRPFMLKIARNLAFNEIRRRNRRPAASMHSGGPDGDPIDPLDEAVERIQSLLEGLPDEQREVIELKLYGELTFEQIGQELQVPVPTAKSRMAAGMHKLREIVRDAQTRAVGGVGRRYD